ncbi:hypothetical protein DFH09DRAFT_1087413 [Mycena vulgaris]|nr:hypothetical protein DFH09DRAFT_1087413 [Mycena vulgaris]
MHCTAPLLIQEVEELGRRGRVEWMENARRKNATKMEEIGRKRMRAGCEEGQGKRNGGASGETRDGHRNVSGRDWAISDGMQSTGEGDSKKARERKGEWLGPTVGRAERGRWPGSLESHA